MSRFFAALVMVTLFVGCGEEKKAPAPAAKPAPAADGAAPAPAADGATPAPEEKK